MAIVYSIKPYCSQDQLINSQDQTRYTWKQEIWKHKLCPQAISTPDQSVPIIYMDFSLLLL